MSDEPPRALIVGMIHAMTWWNDTHGATRCGISFALNARINVDRRVLATRSDQDPDCMACIAELDMLWPPITAEPGVAVINTRAISKLDFFINDKEPEG